MEEIKPKTLPALLVAFRLLALKLNSLDVRAQNFIVTLLMRHCQARMGMESLEPFGGKPPDNPDTCLMQFRKTATQLEQFLLIDETFIVNALQQTFQRRMAIDVGELQGALAQMQQPNKVVN